MAALRLERLVKTFPGSVTALKDFDLSMASGELVVLLGPSGAGKTTVLRLIAGLETPDQGRIYMDGHAIDHLPPEQRDVAMAFQSPALFPGLTVEDNIRLGLKLRKMPDSNRRLERIASRLELTPLLDRFPETLSGGEQQRTALARALAVQPRVLLLDEPLAALDPITRAELRQSLRALQKELQLTTVYVTHDWAEAVALADRLVILREGRIQQTGTASDIFHDPANLFVARFAAPENLNLLRGALVAGARGTHLECGGARIALPQAPSRRDVICAFRSSALRIDPEGPILAAIQEAQSLGWVTRARLAAENQILVADLPPGFQPPAGVALRWSLDPGQLFFFDPATEKRIVAG